jgi:hypothetical protein
MQQNTCSGLLAPLANSPADRQQFLQQSIAITRVLESILLYVTKIDGAILHHHQEKS